MAVTHTPGPWVSEATGSQPGAFSVVGDGQQMVALVYGANRDEQEANARLVEAALDMLEALKGIEHFSDAVAHRQDPISVELRKWIASGRTAIAKADGRQLVNAAEQPMRCRWCDEVHSGGPENCDKPEARPAQAR